MKDKKELFLINPDGTLSINKIEVRAIPEYKKVLIEDKGSKGDANGRKKYLAFKEFLYIHLYSSPLSIYRDLPEEKRHNNSRADAGLPEDWERKQYVLDACSRYEKDMKLSSLFYSYLNSSKAVYGIGEDIEYFNQERNRLRNSITEDKEKLKTEELEGEIQDLENRINHNTTSLLDIGKKLISLSNSLPDAFTTLESLKKRLSAEEGKGKELYGGGKLGNREQV